MPGVGQKSAQRTAFHLLERDRDAANNLSTALAEAVTGIGHCSRCRMARGAAHASNLIVGVDALRFTAGEDAIRRYKIPDAKYFTQSFCVRCAGKVPMVDRERAIAVVPLGGLDDPPPIAPREHIWTADVPSWSEICDDLPQHEGPPA